ncbi:cytochrome b/b6 domain-containing protein [Nocardioides albus]|uniref:Cytochrome b561 n=1 Tax=Nocardioides albus TaxID=1841 RepID=A0A7W5A8D1_9ACTN|nr:cytochrome b/b6 domain-containing protein [Nocardioides albus]MBB3091250.1 cytochrome b561 [Nocardioides albus]
MSGAKATGYGVVTKTLHWLTVAAFVLQFVVGYVMSTEAEEPLEGTGAQIDCDPPGEDRSGGDTSDAEEERMDRLEEACEAERDRLEERGEDTLATAWSDLWSGRLGTGGITLPELHILLGLAILLLGGLRVGWRLIAPLPPWDQRLTASDRRLAHVTERALLTLMFVVPLTGLALVAVSDDLVALHVAAHIAFFVALGAHVLLVLSRGLLPRMLPGTSYVSKDRA